MRTKKNFCLDFLQKFLAGVQIFNAGSSREAVFGNYVDRFVDVLLF